MVFYVLAQIISWISTILIILLLARSALSLVVFSGYRYNSQLNRINSFLKGITEPIVAPVRRLISRFINTGSIDLAPLATFFIITIVRLILIRILISLA